MARGKKILKIRAAAKKITIKYDTTVAVEGVVGKYYPGDDVVAKKGPAPVRNPTKIRATITPGVVLILLAGRFRGKRVVCLKVLSSGLLLVSGPYGINGVPLRRVNQKYVIATSASVNVSKVDVSKIDDALFAREKVETGGPSATRKAAQDKVDAALTKSVAAVPQMDAYLKNTFTLSKADKPHNMVF